MDPLTSLTTALAAGAVEQTDSATKQATGLMSRLLGPAADELGEALADRIKLRRARSTTRMLLRAEEMMARARLEPKEVPLKALTPIIEGAGLEEGEGLTEQWAALLANAAAGNDTDLIPSFASLLRELSPTDVRILDALYGHSLRVFEARKIASPVVRPPKRSRAVEPWEAVEVGSAVGVTEERLALAIENLVRLGLILDVSVQLKEVAQRGGLFDQGMDAKQLAAAQPAQPSRRPYQRWNSVTVPAPLRQLVRLSVLGAALVESCQPPQASGC